MIGNLSASFEVSTSISAFSGSLLSLNLRERWEPMKITKTVVAITLNGIGICMF